MGRCSGDWRCRRKAYCAFKCKHLVSRCRYSGFSYSVCSVHKWGRDSSGSTKALNNSASGSSISESYERQFNGTIDDARIYNRALSATEVQQLYKLGTANAAHSNVGISDGLVGYWTFDGGSPDWRKNQVADISGNGSTGTLVSISTSTSPAAGKWPGA